MKPVHSKRVYQLRQFIGDVTFLGVRLIPVIDAYRSARIPWHFAEKIMLSTTAVNDCVYCARIHTQLAKTAGVDVEEIQHLLHSEINREVEAYEYRALCFAQHYAETNRHPDPAEIRALIAFYGEKKANDIMLYIRLIYVGNLIGNSFDALRSRLTGKPHPQSSALFEAFLMLFAVPVIFGLGIPLMICLILLTTLLPPLRQLGPQSHLPLAPVSAS